MRHLVIIPARYESSRLPGKPLVPLLGVPMIIRTVRRCWEAVSRDSVVVATDDDRIVRVCEAHDVKCMMTSRSCLTGTDRVAEAARKLPADVYVNVQGDEPLFAPEDLRRLIEASSSAPDRIFNGYCEIDNEDEFRSTSIPKVVFAPDGRLLYMSRGMIPSNKQALFRQAWRQVCAYAFPAKALQSFAEQPVKTPLEELEDIEILRFLELGWNVEMLKMSRESISVDQPADIARAEAALRAREQ